MATGFGDLFTYGLAIGIILLSLVIGIFNNAGIGPSYTAPEFAYNASSTLLITSDDEVSSSGGYEQAADIASKGFWACIDGFKTILTDLPAYMARYNIPVIVSAPAQVLVWIVFGYEMLMLKRIIWG
jgi:hypothetical protein